MSHNKCGQCKFYQGGGYQGECHRMPPTNNKMSYGRGVEVGVWPMVDPREDWCGEFAANAIRIADHPEPAFDPLSEAQTLSYAPVARDAVLWVNPDDLANPHFIGINAAKAGHELHGKHYTMPLYAEGQDWLPIESAPKDGTEILTYRVANGSASYRINRYSSKDVARPGWWSRDPTHWKPLTPPAMHTGAEPQEGRSDG